MKRFCILLTLCLFLSGCGSSDDLEVQVEREAPPVAQILAMMPTEAAQPVTEAVTEPATIPTEVPAEPPTEVPTETAAETAPDPIGQDYVLNTNTKKFHYPHCSSVSKMKAKNRRDHFGSSEEILSMGYDPCKICKP